MKIFAISLIKDEEDIIEFNLSEGLKWADKIFVLDNGSSDRTWEIVNRMAVTNDKIVPWKQDFRPYREEMRSEVYNQFKHLSEDGDWWCNKFDSDEFYIDNPREFLSAVPRHYHVVKHESIDFQLTHEDVEEFSFAENETFDASKIRYYKPDSYSEQRFFKFRKKLLWLLTESKPRHMGIIYPKKIRLKHFQYRTPFQIQKRLDIRRKLYEGGFKFAIHDSQTDWKEKLFHRKDLVKYIDDEHITISECRYDTPPNPWTNLVKKIAHRTGIFP